MQHPLEYHCVHPVDMQHIKSDPRQTVAAQALLQLHGCYYGSTSCSSLSSVDDASLVDTESTATTEAAGYQRLPPLTDVIPDNMHDRPSSSTAQLQQHPTLFAPLFSPSPYASERRTRTSFFKKSNKRSVKPRWLESERLDLFQAIVKEKQLDDMTTFPWDRIAAIVGRDKKACKDQWRREVLPALMRCRKPEPDDDSHG